MRQLNQPVRTCGAEGEGGCETAGCEVCVPTWADAGFTPSVQILRQLQPICHENNTGSGASSEKIAQGLTLSVELKDQQYLIPRLDLS